MPEVENSRPLRERDRYGGRLEHHGGCSQRGHERMALSPLCSAALGGGCGTPHDAVWLGLGLVWSPYCVRHTGMNKKVAGVKAAVEELLSGVTARTFKTYARPNKERKRAL